MTREWATVDVDLGPADSDTEIDDVEPIPLARARDVIDILALDGRFGIDCAAVAAECARVFKARALHEWPIFAYAFPTEWQTTLPAIARDARYDYDVSTIETRFNTLLARMNGVIAVAGYEYQFVTLAARPTDGGPFADPIETGGPQYEHFVQLARNGWSVKSMITHPRGTAYILVLLERELAPPA